MTGIINTFAILKMEEFNLNFSDTQAAFKHKSNAQLKNSKFIFSIFKYSFFVNYGPTLTSISLKLKFPIKGIIKSTIFSQFCGGETIDECDATVAKLWNSRVGSILDYSVEGEEDDKNFDANTEEIIHAIEKAKGKEYYSFCVFKPTGIGRFALLEMVNSKMNLNAEELDEFYRFKGRFEKICKFAYECDVRLFIDAEESWIQESIDELANSMMEKYNKEKVIIFNTVQLYLKNRLSFIETTLEEAKRKNYKVGFKLVRGAYLEKETLRAEELKYDNPIQDSKQKSDEDYNKALRICFEQKDMVSVCAGTHNEESSKLLAKLMHDAGLKNNDDRFWFAQLYGMSDNISFNLAALGYNVAKYVPYGPIISVIPYLGRRAKENSSMSGQMGRELSLIVQELRRRKSAK